LDAGSVAGVSETDRPRLVATAGKRLGKPVHRPAVRGRAIQRWKQKGRGRRQLLFLYFLPLADRARCRSTEGGCFCCSCRAIALEFPIGAGKAEGPFESGKAFPSGNPIKWGPPKVIPIAWIEGFKRSAFVFQWLRLVRAASCSNGICFGASLHFWGRKSDWRIKGLRSRSNLRGYGSNAIALAAVGFQVAKDCPLTL